MNDDLHDRLDLVAREMARRKAQRFYTLYPETGPLRRSEYPKHMEAMAAGKDWLERLVMAGNRVGKTIGVGAYETACHMTGVYPSWWKGVRFKKAVSVWAVGTNSETTFKIVQAALIGTPDDPNGMIPENLVLRRTPKRSGETGAVATVTVRHVSGGTSVCEFKSYEMGRKGFEGREKDFIWLDEEPPMDIYQECLFRLLTTQGRLLLTFTPLQGRSDVVKAFLEPEDKDAAESKIVIQAGWKDVPHLDESMKRKILAGTLPYQREARMNGEPVLGVGVIYPIAESDITNENFAVPDTWPKGYGFDVGWKRTAAPFVTREMGTNIYYIYDCHYIGSEEPPSQAMGIKARGDWLVGAIDPASRGRSQVDGRRLIAEYKKLGLDLVEADNAIEAGILTVWTMLVSGQLRVMAKCLPWFKEFRNYHRDEAGQIVKKDDHLMDGTRYWARTGINHMKPKPMRRREGQGLDLAAGDRSWMGN